MVEDFKVQEKKLAPKISVPRKARCHYIHDLATTFGYDTEWKSIVMRELSSPPKKIKVKENK